MLLKETQNKFYDRWSYLIPSDISMAVFRIIIGFSMLFNLLHVRMPCLKILYGRDRFFPPEITRYINNSTSISIFDYIHNDVFAVVFFVIGVAACLLFIIGKWTRPAGWTALFVFWNMLQSNFIFTFGFDHYTFNIFLCGLLLPLNNTWSLDSMDPTFQRRAPRLGFTFVLLVQISVIYFVTGILKNGESWIHGYAVRNMLSDPYSTSMLGKALRDLKWFYVPSTYITLVFEVLTPVFIFVKTKNNWLRWSGAITIIAFHILILLTYKVANFSISGLAVGCFLLPLGSISINFDAIKTPSVNKGLALAGNILSIIWMAVIINSAFFYVATKAPFSNSPLVNDIRSSLSFLNIQPIEVSPFYQKWTMFAPNPYAYTGWIAIEMHEDGSKTELTSGRKVLEDRPVYKPKGWMHYMAYYARKWNKHENPKYFLFVKYWIYHTLEKNGLSDTDERIFLVDYERHILLEKEDYITPLTPKVYPINQILDYPLELENGQILSN